MLPENAAEPSRVDVAYRLLIDFMDREDFPEGSKLPSETEFVDRLGLSRASIREALARIRAEGRVVSRRGAGTFATRQGPSEVVRLSAIDSVRDLIEWHEFRLALESEVVALAAERRSDAQLADIVRAQDELVARLDEGLRGDAEDAAFHRAIALGSQNGKLIDAVGALTAHFFRWNRFSSERGILSLSQRREVVAAEHGEIIAGIAARKPEKARAALRSHLLNGKARALSSLRS
jgi:DNA-binding FadR family transcriptional regulator